jgi:hypothetical protein
MRALFCQVHTREWTEGCYYAVVVLDDALLQRIERLHEASAEAKARIPDFYKLAVWDYSVHYLTSLPEAWVDWAEEIENDVWVDVPFEMDEDLDVLASHASRTECEQLCVSGTDIWWTANPKYSGHEVSTPYLPGLSGLERLSLINTKDS